MNKSVLSGVLIGAGIAIAGGLYAGYRIMEPEEPTVVAEAVPADVDCVPEEPRDEHRIAGTAIGAVVGGAVGRDVGDRDITTAAGAAAGAIAGNQIQKEIQENQAEKRGC
ncbi:MAG TPA: glycine zipper 2TM domain-containing protein [Gammaproteobacteria bacterium]|jgi:uncharacterized protein YcfJ|nr:glycine zipper 2TM domain-containing protein [Gammaproteobacteria bacterium]